MHRLVTLAKLIGHLGPVKGEKSLQKQIYLVDSRTGCLGYHYRWETYGPVSFQLQQDMTELSALGLIRVEYQGQVPVYHSVENHAHPFWQQQLAAIELDHQVKTVVEQIRQLGPRRHNPTFLEVVASLHFLQQQQHPDPVNDLSSRYSADLIRESLQWSF